MNQIFKKLNAPLKGKGFIYLLLLNIISNIAALYFVHNLKSILCVIFVSFVAAYLENAIAKLFSNPIAKKIVYTFWIVLHNVLIVIDYYLMFQFNRIFNQDITDILFETNLVEINNFIDTYLTAKIIFAALFILVLFNLILYLIAKYGSKLKLTFIYGLGVLIGLGIYCFMVFNFIVYRSGMGITQYNTLMRVSHSLLIINKTYKEIDNLTDACSHIEARQTFSDKPSIILVIGESASVYHSYLYGYEKNTTPLIAERVQNDSLVVFDNVISAFDSTHKAMETIFSISKNRVNFSHTPLFPAVFKSINYQTIMYDNQYFRGEGVTFMSDKDLSDLLYDFRNKERNTYDGDMVKEIKVNDNGSLYVIHLWGQHYTYSQRYPKRFNHFQPSEYDTEQYTLKKREIIAHYDNATLYNDYVLNEIIKKFEKGNCCVIYLSDHGEEIYEFGDFMGHGGAEHHKDVSHLVRVPFWIWMSPQYKKNHPDVVKNIQDARSLPGITDDVSHMLLELAGIETKLFSPSRSMINDNYDTSKPRIVLNAIDYDKK